MSLGVATRTSSFAIISAIEQDLRRLISDEIEDIYTKFPQDVKDNAEKRMKLDEAFGAFMPDSNIVDYIDFADISKLININLQDFNPAILNKVKEISSDLVEMTSVRNRVCHSRPLEATDLPRLRDFASKCLKDLGSVNFSALDETLNALRENPRLVYDLEIPRFWLADLQQIPNNLPQPEFDDTGFVGRTADLTKIKKNILGPYPVITVIGEGGVGKTALVIKALYDLADDKNTPFDHIVWTSLKTKSLAGMGIKELNNSIRDVKSLLISLGEELGVPNDSLNENNIVLELKEYLSEFRVLLVIDNLESIETESLREIFEDLETGSKVLITSRTGLLEFEIRMKLDAFDDQSASRLMRQFASSLNINHISSQTPQNLINQCNLLHNSPLLIKWFVSSVALGSDESILNNLKSSKNSEAIKFCFENLYDKLSDVDKALLKSIIAANKPLSRAEIHYITEAFDYSSEVIDFSLNSLNQSSMLSATNSVLESSMKVYTLSSIAADYMKRFDPPNVKFFGIVQQRIAGIRIAKDREYANRINSKYTLHYMNPRNSDEVIASQYLNDAIRLFYDGNVEKADAMIEKAQNLAPKFPAVYRVSAFRHKSSNIYLAIEENKKAVEVDSKDPTSRYALALCYIDAQIYDIAIAEINIALKYDQKSLSLKDLLAVAYMRSGDLDNAERVFREVREDKGFSKIRLWRRMNVISTSAENFRRMAEKNFRDPNKAIELILKGLDLMYNSFSEGLFDTKMTETTQKLIKEGMGINTDDDELYAKFFNLTTSLIVYLGAARLRRIPGLISRLEADKNSKGSTGKAATSLAEALARRS